MKPYSNWEACASTLRRNLNVYPWIAMRGSQKAGEELLMDGILAIAECTLVPDWDDHQWYETMREFKATVNLVFFYEEDTAAELDDEFSEAPQATALKAAELIFDRLAA